MKFLSLGLCLATCIHLSTNSIALAENTSSNDGDKSTLGSNQDSNSSSQTTQTEASSEKRLTFSPESNGRTEIQKTFHSGENTEPLISNGNAVLVEDLGVQITPIAGWEVSHNKMGMSLVIQAPKATEVVYDKVTYRPNLTVVAIHDPTPIDELAAKDLKKKLAESIAKGAGVTQVVMDENHRFFDYRNKNDGLVIYSSFTFGEAEMQQIHVIVSGEEKQFHLTYTDLASELQKDEVFNAAWSIMSSIEVTGDAPIRFEQLKILGAAALLSMLLFGFLLTFRKRRFQNRLNDYANNDSESEDLFLSSESSYESSYQLSDNTHLGSDEWSLHDKYSDLPKTRTSRAVSSQSYL